MSHYATQLAGAYVTNGAKLRSRLSLTANRPPAVDVEAGNPHHPPPSIEPADQTHKPLADITGCLGNHGGAAAVPPPQPLLKAGPEHPPERLQLDQPEEGLQLCEDDEDDLPCFDILDDLVDAQAAADEPATDADQQSPVAHGSKELDHGEGLHPPGAAELWDYPDVEAGAAPTEEADGYDTPGLHRLRESAAAGPSAGHFLLARGDCSTAGGTGRRARVSSRRQQCTRYTSMFGDDDGSDKAAGAPGRHRSAAAGLDDSDLFDVPGLSSKKKAVEQQQQQADGVQPQQAFVRRLPSSFSLGTSWGANRSTQLPTRWEQPQPAASQPGERPGFTSASAAVAGISEDGAKRKAVRQGAAAAGLRSPAGCQAATGASATAGLQQQPSPVELAVPDSEDEDDFQAGRSLRSHGVQRSGSRAPLQRLVRAGSLPAGAGPGSSGSSSPNEHSEQGQPSPCMPSTAAAGVQHGRTAQQAGGHGRLQPDAASSGLHRSPPAAKPWAAQRSMLTLSRSEPAAAAGARLKTNPFARADAKPTRVVLAPHDRLGAGGARAVGDASAMMQSVLDSLPPPPSPPPPAPSPAARGGWQQPQAWQGGSCDWKEKPQGMRHQEPPPWNPDGSSPPRQQQQQQQQQQHDEVEQGQVLTWAEQSKQYRLQEQNDRLWHQPAWLSNDAQPHHVLGAPQLQQQWHGDDEGYQEGNGARQMPQGPRGQHPFGQPSWNDSDDDFDQPVPSNRRLQLPYQQQQQQQQQGGRREVINLLNSPVPSFPHNSLGPPGDRLQHAAGGGLQAGQPWWRRLPDLVPVEVLSKGKNPRDGSQVYIDYRRQFSGATGGGVTAASRQAARQQQQQGADGFAPTSEGGQSRPKKRQVPAAGQTAGGGHWEGSAGQKAYVNSRGQTFYGQRAWLEYCKETGKEPSSRSGSGKAGGKGSRKRKGGGEGGKRKRKSGGKKARAR